METKYQTTEANDSTVTWLQADLHTTFKRWYREETTDNLLNCLHLVRDGNDGNDTTVLIVQQALTQLAREHPVDAEVVRSRFFENCTTQSVANQLNISIGHYYRIQKRAIARLTKMIQQMEQSERAAYRTMLKKRLEPPTYLNLIGADVHLKELTQHIVAPGPPWVFSIEGLGGIGKTSFANALARHTIDLGAWENVAWVTARQQQFNLGGGIVPIERPALTVVELVRALMAQLAIDGRALPSSQAAEALLMKRLAEQEHLVVIDNLETIADLQSLLPILRRLANPTKFLVTTRESLRKEPDIVHFVVPPLNEQDALQLMREEAIRNNLPAVAAAADQDLRPIYETVGGNPLALRLIIGQLHVQPLQTVLTDLMMASGEAAERLYTYIYRRLWEQLDEQARLTLLAMPLVVEQGGTFELLAGITHMAAADLSRTLDTLSRYNLIDGSGGINDRQFSIHSLTRAFLHEQVVRWQ